jgi:ribosomal protein S14
MTDRSIEDVLPPESDGGVHLSYSPSREHMREMAENGSVEHMIGMQYSKGVCGTWQFVERLHPVKIREQCDGCGKYRIVKG